jgi:hypothetical protein
MVMDMANWSLEATVLVDKHCAEIMKHFAECLSAALGSILRKI